MVIPISPKNLKDGKVSIKIAINSLISDFIPTRASYLMYT